MTSGVAFGADWSSDVITTGTMVAICDTERLDSRPAAAAAAADEDGTVRHPVALPLVPMLAPRV